MSLIETVVVSHSHSVNQAFRSRLLSTKTLCCNRVTLDSNSLDSDASKVAPAVVDPANRLPVGQGQVVASAHGVPASTCVLTTHKVSTIVAVLPSTLAVARLTETSVFLNDHLLIVSLRLPYQTRWARRM